jgi:hypothetical protein
MTASGANVGLSFAQRSTIERISLHHKFSKIMLSYVDGLTKIRPNVKHTTDVSIAFLQNMLSCMSTSAIFFFCGTTIQMGPRPPHCWIFLDHTQLRTHTPGSSTPNEWSAHCICCYLRNTQQTQMSTHPWPQRDSNLRSQQWSGRRPTL